MRIAKASVEMATAPQFDTVMKNYDLDTALIEAYELVKDFIAEPNGKSKKGKKK